MEKKMTKKEAFSFALNLVDEIANPDVYAVIAHEIEMLSKAKSRKGDSEKVKANEKLAMAIFSQMEEGVAYTVAEIAKSFVLPSEIEGKNQKLSYLMTFLANEGYVTKEKVKGDKYAYTLSNKGE